MPKTLGKKELPLSLRAFRKALCHANKWGLLLLIFSGHDAAPGQKTAAVHHVNGPAREPGRLPGVFSAKRPFSDEELSTTSLAYFPRVPGAAASAFFQSVSYYEGETLIAPGFIQKF